MVGLLLRSVRTPFGQSGTLRGLRLILAKWRYLVPGERRDGAQSRPPAPQKHAGHNTSREALRTFQKLIR